MTPTVADYERVFALERQQEYPVIDALEKELGYAIDRQKLEAAARVLACPVKKNAANWQHGRVIYAVARARLALLVETIRVVQLLDVGTAKGFSALCLQWALNDSGQSGEVVSVDVIAPDAQERRNTVAECDGLKTLPEILAPWPESKAIRFEQSTGRDWLIAHSTVRVHVAVVDGKHTFEVVRSEASLLAARQQSGDVIFFDDLQIDGVKQAVRELRGYDVECLQILPHRQYAIARKR